MARKNRSIGSAKVKNLLTNINITYGEAAIDYVVPTEGITAPSLASAAPTGGRSFTVDGPTKIPIIFHIPYEGSLTDQNKEELIDAVILSVNEANKIFAGAPEESAYENPDNYGAVLPINNEDYTEHVNIELVLADRVSKNSLMPFIPTHTYSLAEYGDDFENAFGPGVDIPGYTNTSPTEADLKTLRDAYEAATLLGDASAEEAALREAEENYYFLLETPGVIFYSYKASLAGTEGSAGKLNDVRDVEANAFLYHGSAPDNFFLTSGDFKLLQFKINARLECLNVLATDNEAASSGDAGDSGIGVFAHNAFQNSLRIFSLKYPDNKKGHILAHEVLHGVTLSHPWGYLTMKGERTKDVHLANREWSESKGDLNYYTEGYTFSHDFIPPFVYNNSGDSFESISSDEKVFVENIINNYLPEFVQDSIYFEDGTFKGGVPFYVSELMATLPTFWGGSYTEVEEEKKFLINPTTGEDIVDLAPLPTIGEQVSGGFVFYIHEDNSYYLVVEPGTFLGSSLPWPCSSSSIGGTSQGIGDGAANTERILNSGCGGGLISNIINKREENMEGYSDWYLPSRYEIQEARAAVGNPREGGYNPAGFDGGHYWSSSEFSATKSYALYAWHGGAGQAYKTATKPTRLIRKQFIGDPVEQTTEPFIYQVGDSLDGGIILTIDASYITAFVLYGSHSNTPLSVEEVTYSAPTLSGASLAQLGAADQIFYATPGSLYYEIELSAVQEAASIYDDIYELSPDAFTEGVVYGFHGNGKGAWGYNPITGEISNFPRLESIHQGQWYVSDLTYVLYANILLPEYVASSAAFTVPNNRKGPKINIYNPVCAFNDPNALNLAFGLGLGWYDARYPKFPEDTLIEDMFSEENCPCLYTEQTYTDTNEDGEVEEFTFTVKGSGGEDLQMEGFTRLGDKDSLEESVGVDILGSLTYLKDVFDSSKWLNTITNTPYAVKVPNFSVYIGFSKDSVIPYAIKGSRYTLLGVDNVSKGLIDNDSKVRAQGSGILNVSNRHYYIGSTDSASPLYNPFKITEDYPYASGLLGHGPLHNVGNTELHNLFLSGQGPADTLYGTVDYNHTLNILGYSTYATLPKYISVGDISKINSVVSGNTGAIGRAVASANLIGLNSTVGSLEHEITSSNNVQTYIDTALDYLDAYDVSGHFGGCTDPEALNYDSTASISLNICIERVFGCTDSTANNYDSSANTDDGTCAHYSLDPISIHPVYVCNDTAGIPCNLHTPTTLTPGGATSLVYTGSSAYLNSNGTTAASLLDGGTWSTAALSFIDPYQYNCDDYPLASELLGVENLSGGCIDIEDNSLCTYPSVSYYSCDAQVFGQDLAAYEAVMDLEGYALECPEDEQVRDITTSGEFFLIGRVRFGGILYTASGVEYIGRFIKDLDDALYEYTETDEINRDNPLFFRNQLNTPMTGEVEKEAKNLMKIKASLDKIINFTN